VIDHLSQMEPPADQSVLRKYQADLRELGKRPQVFLKISEVLRRVNGRVPVDLNFYRPRLDEFWDIFGQDRLIYGSDWPNSDLWAPYPQVLKLAREYITSKGPEAAEKFFWKNSVRAYRWVKRDAAQPQASGI
jgi:predicted TIM-barrel fold metal-dependent hydrolase